MIRQTGPFRWHRSQVLQETFDKVQLIQKKLEL